MHIYFIVQASYMLRPPLQKPVGYYSMIPFTAPQCTGTRLPRFQPKVFANVRKPERPLNSRKVKVIYLAYKLYLYIETLHNVSLIHL